MEKQPYVEANVLVFDQNLHLRKQTRSILNIIGFWRIEECESLDEAHQALSANQFDLAILTVHDRHDGVSALVNDLRRLRCGEDPFLPIILTSWDARLRVVRSIINSGADDFSSALILRQI
jgi:PleD family two-component response regulator